MLVKPWIDHGLAHISHERLIRLRDVRQVLLLGPHWRHALLYCLLSRYHVRGDHLCTQITKERPTVITFRLTLHLPPILSPALSSDIITSEWCPHHSPL